MRSTELKAELRKRGLRTTGRKNELRERLREATEARSSTDDDESDAEQITNNRTKQRSLTMTFKDVEESLEFFSGDEISKKRRNFVTGQTLIK